MVRRKIRRYEGGGKVDIPYAQLGQIAGGIVDTVDPVNKYGAKSDFSAGASGALKGAGTGAAIGSVIPGIGTAAGAVVGGVIGGAGGVLENNKAQAFQTEEEKLAEIASNNEGLAKLSLYDQTGSNNNQVYAKFGGSLKRLSNDSLEINGNSHENGGVSLGQGVEVEGGETMNKDFVFSEELGFAQKHKPIARAIGKLESKVPNNITNDTIKFLKEKEANLKTQQEELKQMLGITPVGTTEYQHGGEIEGPGDPPPTYVPLTKRFRDKSEHEKFYQDAARTKFKSDSLLQTKSFPAFDENRQVLPDDRMGKGIDYNTAVIIGGGLPQWAKPAPQRIVYKPLQAEYKQVGIRPDAVRQGYNKGEGRLGFKVRR